MSKDVSQHLPESIPSIDQNELLSGPKRITCLERVLLWADEQMGYPSDLNDVLQALEQAGEEIDRIAPKAPRADPADSEIRQARMVFLKQNLSYEAREAIATYVRRWLVKMWLNRHVDRIKPREDEDIHCLVWLWCRQAGLRMSSTPGLR